MMVMDLRKHQWIMKAKREGICSETKKPISVGDTILFIPAAKRSMKQGVKPHAFCESSKMFSEAKKDVNTGYKDGL